MSTNAQKIVHIVKNSELSQDDKKVLLKHFLYLSEDELKHFVPVLQSKPELLKEISILIREKIEAFKKGDQDTWGKLLDREIELFESMEST